MSGARARCALGSSTGTTFTAGALADATVVVSVAVDVVVSVAVMIGTNRGATCCATACATCGAAAVCAPLAGDGIAGAGIVATTVAVAGVCTAIGS
jgi:hypothetical protein